MKCFLYECSGRAMGHSHQGPTTMGGRDRQSWHWNLKWHRTTLDPIGSGMVINRDRIYEKIPVQFLEAAASDSLLTTASWVSPYWGFQCTDYEQTKWTNNNQVQDLWAKSKRTAHVTTSSPVEYFFYEPSWVNIRRQLQVRIGFSLVILGLEIQNNCSK